MIMPAINALQRKAVQFFLHKEAIPTINAILKLSIYAYLQARERMATKKYFITALGMAMIFAAISGCSTATTPPTAAAAGEQAPATPTPAAPTPAPATPTTRPANQYSDGQLEMVLEKTERMQELPEELSGMTAEQGKEFIVFTLIVTDIKNVHITNMLGSRDNPMTLVVDSGEKYTMKTGSVTGVTPIDVTNITAGYELAQDAQCFYVFEVPEGTQPASLTILYAYKNNLDDANAVAEELIIEF